MNSSLLRLTISVITITIIGCLLPRITVAAEEDPPTTDASLIERYAKMQEQKEQGARSKDDNTPDFSLIFFVR